MLRAIGRFRLKPSRDAVLTGLSRQMQALRVGPALEEGSQMGAVASAPQQQSNLRYVALARAQGCTVIGG